MRKGITTNKQRQHIEYRPQLSYIPPVVYIEDEDTGEEVQVSLPEELVQASEVLISDALRSTLDLRERLTTLIEECEQRLQGDAVVTKDERVQGAIAQCFPDYGSSNKITFEQYRQIKLKDNFSSQESLIMETYEVHHLKNLAGKLEVPILDVAYSMLDSLNETVDFMLSDLFDRMVDPRELAEITRQEEVDKLNEWMELDIKRQRLLSKYRVRTREGAPPQELERMSLEYKNTRSRLVELSEYGSKSRIGRKIYERAEKLDDVLNKWDWLLNGTMADLFGGSLFCAIKIILQDIETGYSLGEAVRQLKLAQALLEYAHANHALTALDLRRQLRNLKKISQRHVTRAASVALGTLKTQAADVIQDWVRNTSSDRECPVFEELGSRLLSAAHSLEIQTDSLIDDEGRKNSLEDAEYKKLNEHLEEKRKASQLLDLLEKLIQALESLERWGDKLTLDEWIEEFIVTNNLNVRLNKDSGRVERFSVWE